MTLPLPDPLVVVDTEQGSTVDPWGVQRDLDQIAAQFPIGANGLQSGQEITTLPTSPVNGQEVFYTADATNGVTWHFKYRSASASTYKWEFVGGAPLFAEVTTSEAMTPGDTLYHALATAGPSLGINLAGDYDVRIECQTDDTGQNTYMSYDIGATGAVDADAAVRFTTGFETTTSERRKTGLTAVTLTAKYKVSGGTGTFKNRRMWLTPVRVG